MARLVWIEPALADLEEIAEYIALSNLPAAKKLVRSVFAKVSRLKEHPASGRIPEELAGMNYREVVVPPCRIYYRIDDGQVFILHVMRQEQDLRKFLLKSEPDDNES
ncbi:MAG: type II toxin-antitoxin system RelE/ParE family toxin [Desulfuromonadales bacterium]|nr:type II toxin-antitoxin system RelE/ParE family toxin [Desulfuromonadales bacterium]